METKSNRTLKEIQIKDSNKNEKCINNVSNNENEEEMEESYLKINTKNEFDIYNSEESLQKLNEIINYTNEMSKDKSSIENISNIFLDKLFPKCNNSDFQISKLISKKYIKPKIKNKIVEEIIQFYFGERMNIRYSKKLILNKENINKIGILLCASYSVFDSFSITETKDLENFIKTERKKDIINDYYSYCNESGKSPLEFNIYNYIQDNKKTYLVPGEFLFLINFLDLIDTVEIDVNIKVDKKAVEHNDDFYLFIITHLNIFRIATLTKHIKINLINKEVQTALNNYYCEKLKFIHTKKNRYCKFNFVTINKINWDFETDYSINNKNKRYFKKKEVKIPSKNNKYSIDKSKAMLKNELSRSSTVFQRESISGASLFNKNNPFPIDNILVNYEIVESLDEIIDKKKIESKYKALIDKYKNTLDIILIAVLGIIRLKKLENLNITMNDSYSKEFIRSFRNNFSSIPELKASIDNFHLLNVFMIYVKNLQLLNIEFNSLDYLSFYKCLSLLKNNKDLRELQMSFFPSNIVYSPQFLLKIFTQNSEKKHIDLSVHTVEYIFLHDFLAYFVENLEILFELIRTKTERLDKLGFNFEMPDIISDNQRYLNAILKFIINILLLIDNKNSKIKKLVIISPKTIIDSRSIFYIQNIIGTINIEKNNKKIKELSIRLQLYHIQNISNLISTNLTNLKIGEVDLVTLRGLTKYLCSFKFYQKSSLNFLTVCLLSHITHFTKEIEYLLNELFSLKIKSLQKISVNTNIIIDDKNNYYKIIENNWISSCIFTVNEKSKSFWKKKEKANANKEKNIYYLIHHELEDGILSINEKTKRHGNNYIKTNCDIAWYLRYILIFKFAKEKQYKLNYYDQKRIIFTILKYIYFTQIVTVEGDKIESSNDKIYLSKSLK